MLRPLACVVALLLPAAAFAQNAAPRLTPERVFADPDLNGPRPTGLAFSPDGRMVTYLKPKPENQQVLDLWAADVAGGEPRRLVDSAALSSGDRVLSEAEKARRERARISNRGIVDYDWDTLGRQLLVPLDGDLWLAEAATGAVRRLTETPGDEVDARISPGGTHVSFVRDQDLYAVELAGGRERRLTTGGGGVISHGVAEFIAQEELDRRTGYWWSPDESRVAYTRVDETRVDIVPRADIGPGGTTVVQQRYPRAGRPNAVVELFVRTLADGAAPVQVDLGASDDIYLARARWAVDGRTLYVQRLSRDQKTLDLLAVDPATGASRIILTERSAHWVNLKGEGLHPLRDGTFLWTTERTGFRHVEHHAADGKLIRTVTSGAWPVDTLSAIDETAGVAYVLASRETPLERHFYRVSYREPGEPVKLTQGAGWWSVTAPKGGRGFLGTYSDPDTPPQTALYDNAGTRLRWIEENQLAEGHPYAPFVPRHTVPEYGTLKADDGTTLHYAVTLPPNFDRAKKHPAILLVYGGPHNQQVKREWGSLRERLFLEAGFVVFRLDNRGSDNRGAAFEAAIDRRLGTVETQDQLVGLNWLKSQRYVDPARVGVSGWSYGGFMTLMLMTDPTADLAAGASGAPPTDWGLYDTAYTERYMGTPAGNAAGYAASDLVARLPRLEGRLLLIHGMADDNVIFENTTRTLAALQQSSTPFETMLYPGERHGVRGQPKGLHLWRTYLDFFTRTLKPEAAR